MKRVIFTRHAEAMLNERAILRKWVEQTVDKPDALEQDPVYPGVLRAFRVIPERGGRVLRVVYVPEPDAIRVVTAYLDRGRKP